METLSLNVFLLKQIRLNLLHRFVVKSLCCHLDKYCFFYCIPSHYLSTAFLQTLLQMVILFCNSKKLIQNFRFRSYLLTK